MIQFAKRITENPTFQSFVIALILITGILSGIETYLGDRGDVPQLLAIIQDVILGCFVVEILLRILAQGRRPWMYFANSWNLFDFLIVTVCVLPLGAQFSAVLRMVRLLRTLRLVTVLPRLQTLVGALLKSIPSLGYIGILLGLHFYMYGVLGTFLFRDNDPWRFGTLHETFLTLFQVLTLEGWNEVLGTQYLGSDIMYDDSLKAMTEGVRHSMPQPMIAAGYFVSFIMLGTMIMLNLFTGVIITSMEEVANETAEARRKANLELHGAVTLRDELALVSRTLKELSQQLEAIETPKDAPQRG